MKKEIEFEILDDSVWEKDEVFTVTLTVDPKDPKVVIGKKAKAEVTIINDDGK